MSDRGGRPSDRTESPASSGETAGSFDPASPTSSAPVADDGASTGRLVVVCGLPGVGKTTVAERIADHVDGRIRRTDVIRKQLFDDPEYTDAETEAVYAELLARARDDVDDGGAVVLDATFADARFRADARETAAEAAAEFDLVEVACDEAVVERRIERRDGISDADFEIHLHFKELFDEVASEHVVVDNSGTEAETFAQVDAAFGERATDGDAAGYDATDGDATGEGTAVEGSTVDGDDRSTTLTDAE
ncbi:AAA family ATPase [Halorubrum ezzemoulense]|jgi:predicted kinase|uniref:Kinase n=1 Tax=Halorubrum ezzemoulense TaxID=337243 RepID=A0A256JD54_HALEZ|nr:AAA family ATPase [Halorubrum ezzemoulense]MDB2237709.1 AAA family ATPase [Halorubrum ezzemoulense]MDB2248797.1 AAA family ATPase [Halorubrum ezzemoulense]MDB2261082.1 AAA family ATPase [Halorubrum ezzemoulense]MDB2267550.1 AAA family ATPase [Halorubrum ezzemoulense]MDB9249796.1 AAA family ATPase [Halorubrum ezzemoulense]